VRKVFFIQLLIQRIAGKKPQGRNSTVNGGGRHIAGQSQMVNEGLQIVIMKPGYIGSGFLHLIRIKGTKAFQGIAIGGNGMPGFALLMKVVLKRGHDIRPGVYRARFSHCVAITSEG